MKIFNRIIITIEVLCAVGILWCVINISTLGTEPKDILHAVDLELPNYTILDKEDNLDRGASRFDNFIYHVTFSPKEETALVKQIKGRGWEKINESYMKTKHVDDDLTYSVVINPTSGTATLEILIDEDYIALYYVYAILFLITAILLVCAWGIVKLVNKNLKKK
ncbi:MAG: hypothetical protein K2J82_06250 [Muribaculaceae bacterium]|nr:hypothetical protein [Muribaculaceae bacterium]MDE6754194.1 hypothetical protein [Muribaculaceae bacterium]